MVESNNFGLIPTNNKLFKYDESDLLNTTYIGIDFGTSTTVVTYSAFDPKIGEIVTKPVWIKQQLPDGGLMEGELLPSVIAWYNNNLLIGQGAAKIKYKLKFGINVWYSFKMELGKDLGPTYYGSELNNSKYTIKTPQDAATVFFSYIKQEIDNYIKENGLSKNIKYAVSIPASFEANQRKDLMLALEKNDMVVTKQSFIDEPNAAFLSYLLNEAKHDKKFIIPENDSSKLLVFDFGAGTCDISILDVGIDLKGLYSKNISISKFERLGGDDIDRFIASEYLFPQLLEQNGKSAKEFKIVEKRRVITQLLNVAEHLKINICNKVALQMTDQELPTLATSDEKIVFRQDLQFKTKVGALKYSEPSLSFKQFNQIMDKFLNTTKTTSFKAVNIDEDINNIYNSVKSALDKAKLKKDDIEYVLLIGGSSKNPYLQASLKKYFNESTLLIPGNLQTHVSLGAAIHCLLLNGFNKNFIQPITSEPIIVITRDIAPKIIFRAGTPIPCDKVVIDDLVTVYDGQRAVELPICLGSPNKILYNLKIVSNNIEGFKKNTPVRLELEISADKLLFASATVMGQTVGIEPISPFANSELTTEERVIYEALKKLNIEAERNGGRPTKSSLDKLADAYVMANKYLNAAETLEGLYELYKDNYYLNDIAVYYSRAGYREKAEEYFELAYTYNKNETTAYNLALQYRYKNKEKAKRLFEESLEINPEYACSLLELGKLLDEENNPKGHQHIKKAYNIWRRKFERNSLRADDYFRLEDAADILGERDFAEKVRNNMPDIDINKFYSHSNLTKSKINDKLLNEE